MIDTRASADILFNHYYKQIKHTIPKKLRAHDHDLYCFEWKLMRPQGIIKLLLEVSDDLERKELFISHVIAFLVVDIVSPRNAILGRNSINAFKMATSMAHLKANFPTSNGVLVAKEIKRLQENYI